MRDFIEYLHTHGGRELDAEEIADILWLAAHLPALSGSDAPPDDGVGGDTMPGTQTDKSRQSTGAGETATPPLPTGEKRADAYLPGSQSEDGTGPGVASLPFRSPTAAALPRRLALGRALRPLKRTAPSPTRWVLDETATVQRIADEGNWLPVLRPARERWLELVLLADESPSMTVWYELVGELQALLEQSGAFRTVQRWGFYADPERPADVRFYAGSRFWDGSPHYRQAGELNDPRGRRLILLVSDCVSGAWRQPAINDLLAGWKETPATLVQVLPERLWGRTGLRFGLEAALRARQPGHPNPSLLALPRRRLESNPLPAGFSLPIVTLEPETLTLWAQGLTAKGSAWMLGVLFPQQSVASPASPRPAGERVAPDAQRLLDSFRQGASEEARLLAGYLSALPLNLPVMRLAQQVMFDEPRQSHLAEVLLSGLVQRKPGQERDTHPDRVEYDFIAGARELLRRAAGERELLIVLARTSAFLDANSGLPIDFPTLLADPSRVGSLRIDEKNLHFASLAAETLKGMGGTYARVAENILTRVSISRIPLDEPTGRRVDDNDIFEQYLADKEDVRPKLGDLYEGTIVEIRSNEILVSIGYKVDGIVPESDLAHLESEYVQLLKVGQTVPVVINKLTNSELVLSITDVLYKEDWLTAERVLASGEAVVCRVISFNKGGLLVEFGQLHGFIPSSQVSGLPNNLSENERNRRFKAMIGKELSVKVTKVDRRYHQLILSEQFSVNESKEDRLRQRIRELEVGEIVIGEVRRILNFGAFVDVGGAEGLLHISEIDRIPVNHPSDVLRVGERIQVMVIRLDPVRNRIGLSRKILQPDPWEGIAERYHINHIIPVTITRVVDFGAFAQLEPGVEGLIHVSELADLEVREPLKSVAAGDRVAAKIIRIDLKRQRIGLSLRQVDLNPDDIAAFLGSGDGGVEDATKNEVSRVSDSDVDTGIDPAILSLLLGEARRGRLTLFIGGDLSEDISGFPSKSDLARQMAARFGQSMPDDQPASLASVAQRAGRQRTRDVIQFLKERLESSQPPQPFDNLLVRLPVQTFITTRYDDRLERAFQQAGRTAQPVITDFDAGLLRRDQPVLVKFYGDLRQPQSLTLSEDDLYDLASAKRDVTRLVENALRGTTLFLGFDFTGPDFLFLWREVLRNLGRFAPMAYAAPSERLPTHEVEVWRDRNVTILDASPLAVVQTLAERLELVGKPLAATPLVKPTPVSEAPFKRYRNFDLELASAGEWIEARVLRSSEGESEEAVAGLGGQPPRLDGIASLAGLDEEIGYRLLPGRVAERWAAALATAENAGEGVRLRLFLRDEAAAAIPWEAAKVGERRPGLRLQTPLVRYVNAQRKTDALRVTGPLRLLVVLGPSAEIGLAALENNRERAGLEGALGELQATGRVQMHWLEGSAVSRDGLQDRLRRVQPHLLHFVGHGEYDEATRQGSLAFARQRDGESEADWVTTEELSILLDGLGIRFGLFNACQTGRGAGGVAHALVRSSLPAAVGMQADVPDDAVIAFAGAFYRALAERWPVDAAVVEARKSVRGVVGLDAPWWALPVLYMRTVDGQLFH